MLELKPIGRVNTPLSAREHAPRQGFDAAIRGTVEIDPMYRSGLDGLRPGHFIDLIWFADRANREILRFDENGDRGVFATRASDRPNPICVSRCEVLAVEADRLHVRGVDMLDRSPVLDVKRAFGDTAHSTRQG